MPTMTEHREAIAALQTSLTEKMKAGETEGLEEIVTDLEKRSADYKAAEAIENRAKLLAGNYLEPSNQLPVTTIEAQEHTQNAEERGAATKADYEPRGWVYDMETRKALPPAIQPPWIQKFMGSKQKEEARAYEGVFEKWMRARTVQEFRDNASEMERRTLNEGTDTSGGFFVPEDFRQVLIHDPGFPGGTIRPNCTVLTTGLKDGYMPTVGSVTWAAFAEEAAYGDTSPTVGQVSFNVNKSGGSTTLSNELLEDSAFNLPGILQQIFGEAKGRYEDQKIINGSGTGEPQGLRVAIAADAVNFTNTTSVIATDLIRIYWNLPSQFRDGAIWNTTSGMMGQIMGIGATAAGIHFGGGADNVDLTAAPGSMLLGARVTISDVASGWDDAVAIAQDEQLGVFGNFRHYYLIDRVGMSLIRNDSINVKNDQVWFGARMRFDGRVGVLNAFRLMEAAT